MKRTSTVVLTLPLLAILHHVALCQWTRVLDSSAVASLAMHSTDLLAGADHEPTHVIGFTVFHSTTNGSTWANIGHAPGGTCVEALAISGPNFIAATKGGYGADGVYLSADNGVTWVASALNTWVFSLLVMDSYVFAGSTGSVLRSTDHGLSWSTLSVGLPGTFIEALCVKGTLLFAGTGGGGVYLSTNNGDTWTSASVGLTNTEVNALAADDNDILAGTWGGGVFRSTDNGAGWSPVNNGLTNMSVWSLVASASNLFAGTNGGVFLSTNRGISWTAANDGLTTPFTVALAVSEPFLFAATTGGVWRRPISEFVSADEEDAPLADRFALIQNYPNPFNPVTTINYRIAYRSHVLLRVFDLLGREVSELVNEVQEPGHRSVQWDGSSFTSGLYFYQLRAGSFLATRTMALTK